MRSVRLGKRLIAGVQKRSNCPGPTAFSRRASCASSTITISRSEAEQAPHRGSQAREVGEEEAAGQREVLREQAIALEGTRPEGQQGLLVLESERLDRMIEEQLAARLPGGTHHQSHGVANQQLVEAHRDLVGPPQEDGQAVQGELAHGQPGRGVQAQTHGCLGLDREAADCRGRPGRRCTPRA